MLGKDTLGCLDVKTVFCFIEQNHYFDEQQNYIINVSLKIVTNSVYYIMSTECGSLMIFEVHGILHNNLFLFLIPALQNIFKEI